MCPFRPPKSKSKRRALSLGFFSLLSLFSLIPFFSVSAAERPASLSLSASSAVLYEPSTGQVFYAKDANTRRPMASTTKIMTALVAIENGSLDDKIKVAKEAVGIEGSSVYLREGETVTLESLLYAVLLASANDAAAAIAYGIAGSMSAFVDMMNEKAAALGLSDTHFVNPHGLHDDDHYTTALELAKIAGAAMKNEVFRNITSTVRHTVSLGDGTVSRVLFNHNRLLLMYKGAIGVKTGFTKASGRCLVGAAERDGLTMIAVTLNAPNDWQDHRTLFDYGFSNYESRTLVPAGDYSLSTPVLSGTASTASLTNTAPLKAILPKNAPYTLRAVLNERPLSAPLSKGEHVGFLYAVSGGKEIASVPLITQEEVTKINTKKGWFGKLFAD